MNTDPIQDFILTNERNLRIAEAVSAAWPEARNQLVSKFLDHLGTHLVQELTGWNFDYGTFFLDRWGGWSLRKSGWENQYEVHLQCWNYGEKMVFGLCRDENHINKRPFSTELLSAIQQEYPSATARKWWEAEIKMQTPALDWRKPDVLWRMHTDPTFLNEVANQLLDVARISEPIVDGLIMKD